MTTDPNKERVVGIVFVLLAQVIFGTTFAVNKYVLNQGVPPEAFSFFRIAIVTLCLLPFYSRCKGDTVWSAKDWRLVAFIGGFAYVTGMLLEYYGTQYTTASNASLLVSTEAIVTVFLCVVILKETLHFTTIIGGIFALIGLFLVVFDDLHAAEFRIGMALFGDVLVFSSVLGWGLYTVFSKKIVDHSHPVYAQFYISLFAAISLGFICLGAGTAFFFLQMNTKAWIGTLYLGAIGSALGHVLYFQALRRLPASIVALTLTLLPVFGVLFSILLLNETLTWLKFTGAVIIIGSVAYVVKPRKDEHPITEDSIIGG